MAFQWDRTTEDVVQLMREAGYRVSIFQNPGSLLSTIKPFVEVHAVLDHESPPVVRVMRVYAEEHENPEYVCVCQLAESCGFDLE